MKRRSIEWMKRGMLLILLITAGMAQAQEVTVSGKITDLDDGSTLPGATVLEKGTSNGTITDIDGNYQLKVNAGATLVVSFVGYQNQEVVVGSNTTIDVALQISLAELDEIVVIGYGEQRKKVATGAIASVTAEKLEGINVQRVDQALQGQISGVYITPSSGQPGAAPIVLIRGISTNGNNSPLVVIDGLVGDINSVNPMDVQSVDVLKDAASTAIYGARGANGVIIITTKKGKSGSIQLNYDGFTGVAQPWRLPEMMDSDQYITAIREKFANSNNTINRPLPQVGEAEHNTNWFDELVSPAVTQNHNLSMSRGTETGTMYLGLGYWDQGGSIGGDKSNFRRYTVRFNSNSKVKPWLEFGQNMTIIRSERRSVPENNAFGSPLADAYNYDPLTPVTDPNGPFGYAISPLVDKEYVNPFARIHITNNFGETNDVRGNFFLKLKPVAGLTLTSDFGVSIQNTTDRAFTPDYYFRDTFFGPSSAFQSYYKGFGWQFENYAVYDKKLGDHQLTFTVGTTAIFGSGEYAGGSRQDIPLEVQDNPNWWYINAGQDSTDTNYGGANVEERLMSYFGRALYNYKERYLLTASIRQDGSSKFGPNNKFGIFPSFSAGWVISEEAFWPNIPVEFFKIRTSWGVNGNDRIDNLAYVSRVSNNRFTYQFGPSGNQIQYFGVAPMRYANPDLKWEESHMLDIGFESSMFNGLVSLEFGYYRKETRDLLMEERIPEYFGANGFPISNAGSIRNSGLELTLGVTKRFRDLEISTNLNASTFKNVVTNVAGTGEDAFINGPTWPVKAYVLTRMEEGLPIGYFRGFETMGIFQTERDVFAHIGRTGDVLQPNAQPGDLIFRDVNGDGVLDNNDQTMIGKPWPDFILGYTLNVKYKSFDTRLVLSANIGNDVYRTYERQDVPYNNYQVEWLDRWTPENTDGTYPRLVNTDVNGNQRASDFYVEDASFMRLRNLQLGYTMPANVLKALGMSKLRVYLSADNLWTITGYTGFDPEIGTTGWILDTGIDRGFYPTNKSFGGGISISL